MGQLIAFPSSSFDHRGTELGTFGPRLLTLSQAAAYCGLTTMAFTKTCPVQPVTLGHKPSCQRFDRHALDCWIDGEREPFDKGAWQNWLALMEGRAS